MRPVRTRGFTLVELLIVIGIISLLMSIAMPSLRRARSMSRALMCKNNLRNLYVATVFYSDDFDGYLPSAEKTRQLGGHWPFRAAKGYRSPYDRRGLPETFGLNALFDDLGYIPSDSGVWVCPDLQMRWMAEYGCTYSYSMAGILARHQSSALARRSPRSLLIYDNMTHYTPSPVGWYVERESRPMSIIPVNERRAPHSYLSRRSDSEQPDHDTFMAVTIDGWIGTNAENRERMGRVSE